jgi:hypothetical protein
MFDNLRDESSNSFYEEPKSAQFQSAASESAAPRRAKPAKFLGMTAPQRLVISFMVMVAVFVLGLMCLLITGKLAI